MWSRAHKWGGEVGVPAKNSQFDAGTGDPEKTRGHDMGDFVRKNGPGQRESEGSAEHKRRSSGGSGGEKGVVHGGDDCDGDRRIGVDDEVSMTKSSHTVGAGCAHSV